MGRSNPEVVGSNPTKVKFSLAHRDSQISFKGVIAHGGFRVSAVLPTSSTQTLSFPISQVLCGSHILIISVLVLQIFNSAMHGYIWSYI